MISRNVARRYAKGLLEAYVEGEGGADLEATSSQLAALAAAVAGHAGLRLLVVNPAIHWEQKAAILDELAERLKLEPLLRRFMRLVAEKERLDHLQAIADGFQAMVDEQRGLITAEVTAPAALDERAVDVLEARLGEVTGRPVRLTAHSDERLLGGMVTRIGDVVYDGSLRSHLQRIRQQLKSGGSSGPDRSTAPRAPSGGEEESGAEPTGA